MSLGWHGRTGHGQLEFPSRFRPVVVVGGRHRAQQVMRVGVEGVELEGSARLIGE